MGKLTMQELMIFVEQIYKNSSSDNDVTKSIEIMRQLSEILEEENADQELIKRMHELCDMNQELKTLLKERKWKFVPGDLDILRERREKRKQWEAQRIHQGRC